jgi:hypothetical protein
MNTTHAHDVVFGRFDFADGAFTLENGAFTIAFIGKAV